MKKIIYLSWGIFIIISSCKKDKVPTPPVTNTGDNCPKMYELRTVDYSFPIFKNNNQGPCMMGFEHIDTNTFMLLYPIVNPSNPYEFAFIKTFTNSDLSTPGELCVFNFCKNEIRVLSSNVRSMPIDWSINDEIIFQGQNGYIQKIKPNGEELQNLFQDPFSYKTIAWSPFGNKFLIRKANVQNMMLIVDSSGNIFKEFSQAMDNFIWQTDSTVLFSRLNQFYSLNVNTEEKINLFHLSGVSTIRRGENTSIYYFSSAIGNYRVENGNIQLIDSNFTNYQAYDFQPLSHNKYLLNRVAIDTVQVGVCSTYIYKRLSVFDKLTGVEREIKFPF
jgi:hypothetical protein